MPREILIQPVLNGFVCRVGCQTVCFGSLNELTSALVSYYNDPENTEKRFLANAVNKPELRALCNAPVNTQGCESQQPQTTGAGGR